MENEGGKGKPKNVTDKEANSLEQGEQAAVVEPQAEPALASSLDLASIETPVRSPHPDHEGWLRWTYDAGAAIAAFPLDARTGTETTRICGCTTAGDIVKTNFPSSTTGGIHPGQLWYSWIALLQCKQGRRL